MKKIYVLIAMLLVTSVTFAQMFQVGTSSSRKFNHEIATMKTPTDTTGFSANYYPQFAAGGQCVTYSDNSGGYVYGVNGNAFGAVAQGYTMTTPANIQVEGVIAWFCGKKSISNDATSKLTFSIFNKPDSIPTTQIGTVTADMLFSACDTNFLAFNCVNFASPIQVNAVDFSVVCSFANIKTDTIGFLSDQDGEGYGFTALKYQTTWMTYKKAYGGLLTNISIFAVVGPFAGIADNYFFEGSKMTFNQNPTRDNLSVSYAVEKDSKVSFQLLSMNGKVVFTQDEGYKTTGNVYTINKNISGLAAGTYLGSLECNGHRLIKKVVVE